MTELNETSPTRGPGTTPRLIFTAVLIAVILAGILSRSIETGFLTFDKYLGDALYAVMIYLMLRIAWPNRSINTIACVTLATVLAIEFFQITGIPASFRKSVHSVLRLISIVLGTKFGILDIVAYIIGISVAWLIDSAATSKPSKQVSILSTKPTKP